MDPDAPLVHRAQQGDRWAFETLVERHETRLYTLAARVLGSREDAADAVQDALLRAWLALPKFRGGSRFSTWLYRITLNAAHDVHAKRRAMTTSEPPEPADPRDRFAESELSGDLQAALNGLGRALPRRRGALRRAGVLLRGDRRAGGRRGGHGEVPDLPRALRARAEAGNQCGADGVEPVMAAHHPDDLTLLAYVEEELTAVERGSLAAHVAACVDCAERVRLLETGRQALRAAPPLELSEARRQALLRRLPERRDWRSFLEPFSVGLRRAVPALVGLLLVAGVVALATQVELGGDDDEAGQPAQVAEEEAGGGGEAEGAQTDATRQQEATGDDDLPQHFLGGTLVRQVQGPPRAVARLLRQIGYPAQVQEGAVVVSADTIEEIRVLLEPRADGPVPVYVR